MQKTSNSLTKFSILLVSVITASAPAINANIPALAKAFPTVPLSQVELLTTIPSFFLMLSILFSSWVAQRIGLKQTVQLGVAITAIAGLTPVFTNSFDLILVSRAAFGLGVGLFNSLLVTIISSFYEDQERSKLIGFQSIFEGLGGVLVTFIAGQLMNFGWHVSFWAYLITIPALVFFTLFVPKISTTKPVVKTENNLPKTPLFNSRLISLLILTFVVVSFYMIMGIKVPTLIVDSGYGTTTSASYVILDLSLGSMAGGAIFGKLYDWVKNYVIVLGFSSLAISMALIALSNTISVTILGGFLTGLGFRLYIPWALNIVNMGGNGNPWATSLILMSYNLAGSMAPYTALLLQSVLKINQLRNIFWMNTIAYLVITILVVLFLVGFSKFRNRVTDNT
ncbi:MFS transporter [Companilactobacillus huachuanensis]|uniref:MFS transporter n=1 Tax=Companilactobacillus huachuanensis TaxID=2559914 RepID=A0ABW1RM72_9LACO|nr:MFS transporter [Companilactobacillus huachuanensis]